QAPAGPRRTRRAGAPPSAAPPPSPTMRTMPPPRLRQRFTDLFTRGWSVRMRVLTVMMAFMAVGLAVTGVLTYAAQFRALEQRINAELWQEHSELILIAEATDDSGERAHTTVESVLLQATESAAPSDYESVIKIGRASCRGRIQGLW